MDGNLGPPVVAPSLSNAAVASEFAATVSSLLRLAGDNPDHREIVRQASIRHGISDPVDTNLRAYNILRAEIRQLESGRALGDDPTRTPKHSELPRDPTIRSDDPRYRYEAVVRAVSGDGVTRETLVTVTSDVPLSAADVQRQAMTAQTLTNQGRDYIVRIGTHGPESHFESWVITAARRD